MAKQITQVGILKNVLTGTELVEIQEASGGFGSSKRTTVQAIADLVSAGIPVAPVQSVQGRYGDVIITKADLNIQNIDNTSDLDKPISTATQAALDAKANIAGDDFEGPLLEMGFRVVTVDTITPIIDSRVNFLITGDDIPTVPVVMGVIGATFGDRNNVIPTGTYTYVRIPYRCRLVAATIVCEPTGSITFDVLKGVFTDWPLDAGDSICGGNKPSVIAGNSYYDGTLAGWDVELYKDDMLTFITEAGVLVKYAYLTLDIVR